MRCLSRALMLLLLVVAVRAEETADEMEIPHPMISQNPEWMVILLIIAAAIFVAALIAGPIIRANTSFEEETHHH